MTLLEMKARVYDLSIQIQLLQQEIQALNAAISKTAPDVKA